MTKTVLLYVITAVCDLNVIVVVIIIIIHDERTCADARVHIQHECEVDIIQFI